MTTKDKRVCVDVGGTFTDCLVLDESSGELTKFKSPTTPSDPSEGLFAAIAKAADHHGREVGEFLGSIDVLVHGTTLATNVLLTGAGAKCGMLTTEGFRDILEIRRAIKPVDISLFNLFIPPNRPLIPRSLRLGVGERTLYTGEILAPLDEDQVAAAVGTFKDAGVDAVAVCFLHAYANPSNEKRAAEMVRDLAPEMYVSTSHETLHVWREFERFNTTAVGAYVGPATANYLTGLDDKLRATGFDGTFLMMLANGLVQTIDQCINQAAYFLHSGPAAAPSAATYLGELLDDENLLSVDMGGTSFDVCMVRHREIPTTTESWVADQRVAIKMVDIESVGAGGGSIAAIDSLGLLKVGPQSAGADPGPACFGRGDQPTVTDADLVLGLIPGDYFLGGEINLDLDRAVKAVESVGKDLGMDALETAESIFATVNATMADQIIEVSTKRGHDVRDCAMVVGGGGGPVHAGFIADRLGIRKIVVPPVAPLYSAFGMFAMDLGENYARSHVTRVANADPDTVARLFTEMELEAHDAFQAIGVARDKVTLRRSVELRYIGQFHEVEVAMQPGTVTTETIAAAALEFGRKHEELYSFAMPWKGIEMLTLRLKATTPNAPFQLLEVGQGGAESDPALKLRRRCRIGGKDIECPVYDGDKLLAGNLVSGPAIIEEVATTVVIPEAYVCHVDQHKNYVLTRRDQESLGENQ
ncbi:MAG: hydantoinase/oxoprolinase family protein [Rhodospirillales bacterium]|jgi:N-methylhydantoinase A|nr:hypothetical protein [Rhodospirillaceae bacterium]MDP6426798.1 hydantoinase/oxoprolinase family protein [Rhodospirillales bacterium]MDP6645836.1 hydantoinase/oxoprolinase family protein [Rhodospirillales bacterium]MDP6843144.1 hydantoinase/oxoprolinase family protein [Rhodospirillales bacterium]|tara:strand:+ start:3668 stop:5767 length:2100 start_codon:yes stop_codon:yes gene_type:complete